MGIVRHGDSSEDIDAQFSKVENHGEKRSLDQKLRLRNFDARLGIIESGAVVKSRKGIIGVEGGKDICYQWNRIRPVFARRPLQFPPLQDRAQKPNHNPATPSEPTVSPDRSVSRKRSIRGKSNHGAILRQHFRYYLKGTCTRTSCEHWDPPECQFYYNGDECLFPHYKVDEQPNKKPKKGYFPKRRESENKGDVAIVKSVSQLGCV